MQSDISRAMHQFPVRSGIRADDRHWGRSAQAICKLRIPKMTGLFRNVPAQPLAVPIEKYLRYYFRPLFHKKYQIRSQFHESRGLQGGVRKAEYALSIN